MATKESKKTVTKNIFARACDYIGFFKLEPRIGRVKYLILSIFWAIIMWLASLSMSVSYTGEVIDLNNMDINYIYENINIYGLVAVSIVSIIVIINSYFLAVRRMHDYNYCAWWLLLSLVPIVNFIWGLVLLFVPGTKGPNRYGKQPL